MLPHTLIDDLMTLLEQAKSLIHWWIGHDQRAHCWQIVLFGR